MSTTRIVTLFGEEIVPDPPKPTGGKGRAKKKEQEDETNADESPANEPAAATESVADTQEAGTDILPEVAAEVREELPQPEAMVTPLATEPPKPQPVIPDRRKLLANIRQTEPKIATAKDDTQVKETRKTKAAQEAETTTDEAPAIIPEDWTGDKKYYAIGEVAALFSVKTSHIRFWTNEFKLKVRTTRKGDRLYTPEQIKELRTIYHLVKERGFTLTGAKTKLKTQNRRDITTIDLKDSLIALREKLQILRDQL